MYKSVFTDRAFSQILHICYFFSCRHQIQPGHTITPLQEAGMENRIQVLKGPFNILQLAQDKRAQFPSPGLFTVNVINRHKQLKNQKPNQVFLIMAIQTRPSQFPLPLCQITRRSKQRCPPMASQWLCQTTVPKPTVMWPSLTASSPTTRPPTPPSPRVSRMVPRRWVFRSPSF